MNQYSSSKVTNELPFASVMVTAILMVICIMLGMVVAALKTYQTQKVQAEKQLLSELALIERLVPSKTIQIIESLPLSSTVLLSPIVTDSLSEQLSAELPILLSRAKVDALGWGQYGLNHAVLVKRVPNTLILLAKEVPKNQSTHTFMVVGLYLSLTILLIMFAFGSFAHAKTQRRLRYISDTANAIVEGNLDKRIPINPDVFDEYSELSKTLNTMLDKNARLMQDLRQVNNNIAHDLKSPLNRMRSRMEVALLNCRDSESYQQALSRSIDDIDSLLKTFQSLLLMGNLDSKSRNYALKPISLSELSDSLAELYEVVAEEAGHSFKFDIAPNINVFANASLFAQVISNLLDNAIKYTPKGGDIQLTVKKQGANALIVISDNGPGIPREQRQAVFERFTRLDSARQLPGSGLGMSLVRSILKIHNASIQLHDHQPGLRIEMRLRAV